MGERISWAEGAEQLRRLQSLLMEALSTVRPEVGYLLTTDEPELLIDYLNRAKQKDPVLQGIVISIKSAGVLIYHQLGAEDGKEN